MLQVINLHPETSVLASAFVCKIPLQGFRMVEYLRLIES